MQLTVDIGEELGDEKDKVTEMVAPIALLAVATWLYARCAPG